MTLSRTAIALLAIGVALNAPAIAAPPIGIGAGASVGAGVHAGIPPVNAPGIPRTGVPVSMPQSNLPQTRPAALPQANANAQTHADARSAVQTGIPLHGTLTSFTGTTASIKLANGQTRTYTVAANESASFASRVGKSIVFRTNANGTIALNSSAKH